MDYRNLGKSGVKVSPLAVGTTIAGPAIESSVTMVEFDTMLPITFQVEAFSASVQLIG